MLPGAHCYAFFLGEQQFNELSNKNISTFYLTDYLANHFEALIIKGMKLDYYPELRSMMFGSYTQLVYLAQTNNIEYNKKAELAACYLGVKYERIYTGMNNLYSHIEKLNNNL